MPRQDPVFSQYLFRESNNIGFGEAKRKLEQYANHYNRGVIPNYLNCIAKVGGAENIRGRYLSESASHNQFNHTHYGGPAPITQSAVYHNERSYDHKNYSTGLSNSTNPYNSYGSQHNAYESRAGNTAYTFGHSQQPVNQHSFNQQRVV